MSKPPVLKSREVVAILQRLGFNEVRQHDSHKPVAHSDGRVTTVPIHQKHDVAAVLVRKIATDIGLSLEESLAHR